MKVRIGFAVGGQALLDISEFGDLVEHLERARFDSVWLPEIFVGGTFDPIVGLSYAAARVRKLKLGTHFVAPGRNPVLLAKTLANLDQISDGRLLLVFVPGLPDPVERSIQGMPAGDRNLWFDQHLPTMRALWAGEQVDGASLMPLPRQQPLEVWFGGKSRAALERVGRLSDGWIGGLVTIDEAIEARTIIETAATAHGREISREHFGINVSYTLDGSLTAADFPVRPDGDTSDIVAFGIPHLVDTLGRWIDAGFSKIVVRPLRPPTDWSAEIDELSTGIVDLQT